MPGRRPPRVLGIPAFATASVCDPTRARFGANATAGEAGAAPFVVVVRAWEVAGAGDVAACDAATTAACDADIRCW
jgi:hypothetical protein